MTADTKLQTLKDQLESETADSERSAAEDSEPTVGTGGS
jgi:hypothetical protein